MKIFLSFILSSFLLVSCGKNNSTASQLSAFQTSTQMAQTSNIAIDSSVIVSRLGFPWLRQYTTSILNHLSGPLLNDMLSLKIDDSDLRSLGCPRYNNLSTQDKTTFLIYFVSAIANVESGYQPNVILYDRDHRFTAGILLISKSAANRIVSPQTGKSYERGDLLNFDINIEVGLLGLRSQLTTVNDSKDPSVGHLFTKDVFIWPSLSHRRDLVIAAFNYNSTKMPWCK